MKRQKKQICGRCRGDHIPLPMDPIPCIYCGVPLCASCSIFHEPPLCLDCVTNLIPWGTKVIVESCSTYTPRYCKICLAWGFCKKDSWLCGNCQALWKRYDTETDCVNHRYNRNGYKCCIPGCCKYTCVMCIDTCIFPEPLCFACRKDYTCEICKCGIPHLHCTKTIKHRNMKPLKVCFRCYEGPELFVKYAMKRVKLPKDMINLIFSFIFEKKRVKRRR